MTSVNWKSRRGWFRAWLVLSVGWFIYANATKSIPSHIPTVPVSSFLLAGEENARKQVDELVRLIPNLEELANEKCVTDTVTADWVELPAAPKKPTSPDPLATRMRGEIPTFEVQSEWTKFNRAELDRSIAIMDAVPAFRLEGRNSATHKLSVSCDSKTEWKQRWLAWTVHVFGPPIIVPLLLFFLFAGGRWILRGFISESRQEE